MKQLVAFPESSFLDEETTVARYRAAIQEVYATLAGGISFDNQQLIEQRQLFTSASAFASGSHVAAGPLSASEVTSGDLRGWQDSIVVTVPLTNLFVEDLLKRRDATEDSLIPNLFEAAQSGVSFEEQYHKEVLASGVTTLRLVVQILNRSALVADGQIPPTLENVLPSPAYLRFMNVRKGFEAAGYDEDDAAARTWTFFQNSEALQTVPFIRIQSLLWASVVKAIANGMKRVEPSISIDIQMMGTLIPYCDAMFLDRFCHGLTQDNPVSEALAVYETQFFSVNSEAEFLEYLEGIESEAPEDHLMLVRHIFGQSL